MWKLVIQFLIYGFRNIHRDIWTSNPFKHGYPIPQNEILATPLPYHFGHLPSREWKWDEGVNYGYWYV